MSTDDVKWTPTPGPGEPFVGAVCFSRRMLSVRGKLSVLELVPDGRVTLRDIAGNELFSYPPSDLLVKPSLSDTFRIRYGAERWWLWGANFQSAKQFESIRQRVGRDDVIIAVPRPADVEEREYERLMRSMAAQKRAWSGLWIGMLLEAGAKIG